MLLPVCLAKCQVLQVGDWSVRKLPDNPELAFVRSLAQTRFRGFEAQPNSSAAQLLTQLEFATHGS